MPDAASMIEFANLRDPEAIELARRAEKFLTDPHWCKSLTERYLAWALALQTGVFFFRLVPAYEGVDEELWIIVGDLPPAYIVCDNAQTWQEALDAYGVEMMKWVEAVCDGRSIAELIPVNVAPTAEYADMLESRIKFIWGSFVDVPPETLPIMDY